MSSLLLSSFVDEDMTFTDAIELCDVEVAKYVMKKNFDPLMTIHDKTPAVWCLTSGNAEILELLFDNYPETSFDYTSLFYESAQILMDNEMVSNYEEFFNLFSHLQNKEAVIFLANMIRNIIDSDYSCSDSD